MSTMIRTMRRRKRCRHHVGHSHTGITATDLFCGAGGSSWGAQQAGVELVMAANHWKPAIDTHQSHFPEAGHDLADISQADPRRYPVTDILIASPECTNHSQARGVSRKQQDPTTWDAPDPKAERSRATMWDVVRFAEQNRYRVIIVENVVEATSWIYWPAWCMAMDLAGYKRRIVSTNSMHHGVPQSRDRIYIVLWQGDLDIDLDQHTDAFCPTCSKVTPCSQVFKKDRVVGRYTQQWNWRCDIDETIVNPDTYGAESILDFDVPTYRIGDRGVTACPVCGKAKCHQHWRVLVPNTRKRVGAGLMKYGYVEPFITAGAGNVHERTPGNRAKDLSVPLSTIQTSLTHALATPPGFMIPLRNHGKPYGLDEPVGTVTAGGNHHALIMRNNPGGSEMITPAAEPFRTMTTKGHQSLLLPSTESACDLEALIDDCGFRMLAPHEVAAAMAFPLGYIPDHYTKEVRVKLAGNAVTPPVMEWIVGQVVDALCLAA